MSPYISQAVERMALDVEVAYLPMSEVFSIGARYGASVFGVINYTAIEATNSYLNLCASLVKELQA